MSIRLFVSLAVKTARFFTSVIGISDLTSRRFKRGSDSRSWRIFPKGSGQYTEADVDAFTEKHQALFDDLAGEPPRYDENFQPPEQPEPSWVTRFRNAMASLFIAR